MRERSRPPIVLAKGQDGEIIYQVDLPPDGLPPVRSGDLADGLDVARQAAAASVWGEPRRFRFKSDETDPVDLSLNDDDALCWAKAVDSVWNLETPYGLSLCLRLIGLVALLAQSATLRALCPLSRAGATLDVALVRAAATVPLSPRGHLDEWRVRAHLALAAPPISSITHSGASF